MESAIELNSEINYLHHYNKTAISISTTAKHEYSFRTLPRRVYAGTAISNFMINDEQILEEVLFFFDGKVDIIYIDVEQKQNINLFKIAREKIKLSQLITVKPNDTTLESCDILIRYHLKDDLYNKNVIVIGTGNLASKIAIRLAERQASVFVKGRTRDKEINFINGLNFLLPKNTPPIEAFHELSSEEKANVIVSFLSGPFEEEETLYQFINEKTIVIDGGINNFSGNFIQRMITNNINVTRLDARIALPYQLLSNDNYTNKFFKETYGQGKINDSKVVSGGFIGPEGSVIVDTITEPSQIIGIADGRGGVKINEQLSESERNRIRKIKQAISKND